MRVRVLAILHQAFAKPPLIDPSILMPQHRIKLRPEPTERFVFVTLAFVVPISAYWAMVALPVLQRGRPSRFWQATSWLLPVALAVLFFAPFIGSDFSQVLLPSKDFSQALLSGKPTPPEHPLRFLAASLAVSAIWCGWLSLKRSAVRPAGTLVSTIAWTVFVFAMLLQMFAWRVRGENSISMGGNWWGHVDAVVYTVSQVVAGRTLLVDMPSQYGLFAEMIGPLFRIVGLSVLKFTTLCALLQVASLSAVFYVVQRFVREPVLKIAIAGALVMVTFETSLWLIGVDEFQFQYWPIRFFGPQFRFWRSTRTPIAVSYTHLTLPTKRIV